jgi:hypothetical protein
MNNKQYRATRKRRDVRYDINPNDEVTIGLGDSTSGYDPKVTSISRLAAFYDAREAARGIAEAASKGIYNWESTAVINPPAVVDPPTVSDGSLTTGSLTSDTNLGQVAATKIDTVAGRRKAAEALNLPSVPKSRRKYERQKNRGRG